MGVERHPGPAQNSDFDEELRSVVGTWRKNRKRLDILRTPDAALYEYSSPADVQEWLKLKSFSTSELYPGFSAEKNFKERNFLRVCNAMKNFKGEKLFKLEKSKLVKLFGQDEGSRLYSQITVQKKMNGFSTLNSNELKNVLAKARKKADSQSVELPGSFDFGSDSDGDTTPRPLTPPTPPIHIKPAPRKQAPKPAAGNQEERKPARQSPSRSKLDSGHVPAVFGLDSTGSEEGSDSDASGATTGTLRAAMDMQRHQVALRANKGVSA